MSDKPNESDNSSKNETVEQRIMEPAPQNFDGFNELDLLAKDEELKEEKQKSQSFQALWEQSEADKKRLQALWEQSEADKKRLQALWEQSEADKKRLQAKITELETNVTTTGDVWAGQGCSYQPANVQSSLQVSGGSQQEFIPYVAPTTMPHSSYSLVSPTVALSGASSGAGGSHAGGQGLLGHNVTDIFNNSQMICCP
uniref:DUF148 domain-containing protein n=1 Tax=Meloidogyne hapla TaxID=6305 RepID=A0A1I8BYH7_MELHA